MISASDGYTRQKLLWHLVLEVNLYVVTSEKSFLLKFILESQCSMYAQFSTFYEERTPFD